MPPVERNMIKHITASGGGTLRAEAGESFRVRELFCKPSMNDTYLTIKVDGRTVNMIRVQTRAGNHAPYPAQFTVALADGCIGPGLFSWLRKAGFDLTIPVPTGTILTVERYAEAGNVCLIYDRYPAGEVKAEEPNGPNGKTQRYLHYATQLAAVTATPAVIDTSLIFTGGDKWPFDGSALGNDFLMRLFGILAAPVSAGDASANKGYTTHMQMYREGDMAFDSKDQVGIPFLGDAASVAAVVTYKAVASVIGPMTDVQPRPGLMLDPPLGFGPGEKLTTQIVLADAAATGIATLELDVCLLLEKGPRTGR